MKIPVLAVVCMSVLVLGCVSAPAGKVADTTLAKAAVDKGTVAQPVKEASEQVGTDSSKPSAPKNALEGCAAIDDKRMMNICLRDSAVKASDTSGCSAIDSDGIRDECYYKIAINTNSRGVCARVGNDAMKTVCEDKLS